jgi:hypothetical protein
LPIGAPAEGHETERVKAQSDGSSNPSYSTNIEIAAPLTVLYGDSADTDCGVTGRRT